ncbi:MAG: TrkA C-terminal domain-containing protein [Thermodesulfobacteriota bacterium]|nr:TrkA C-terminal domain-containing protein [Thermodesulfobacteriota bacterium]
MIAIISLLLVVLISIIITRVASIALTHTGISREAARFQARSAFTGSGFTTNESEMVVNHPIRRRIVLMLMLLGNAGFVTAVSSLILTFIHTSGGSSLTLRIVVLVTGLAILWSLAYSKWVDKKLSLIIDKALKRFTRLDVVDYASLLHLHGDYRLAEIKVEADDWLSGKPLQETRPSDEGVMILGIKKPNDRYIGTPTGNTTISPDDVLVAYGRIGLIQALDQRKKGTEGDAEHQAAVKET